MRCRTTSGATQTSRERVFGVVGVSVGGGPVGCWAVRFLEGSAQRADRSRELGRSLPTSRGASSPLGNSTVAHLEARLHAPFTCALNKWDNTHTHTCTFRCNHYAYMMRMNMSAGESLPLPWRTSCSSSEAASWRPRPIFTPWREA